MRRYQMAKLASVLDSVPELRDRLIALGQRFENVRVPDESEAQASIAQVFDTFYGAAAMQLDQLDSLARAPRPNELIAVEESLARADGQIANYLRTVQGAPAPTSSPSSSRKGMMWLAFGALALGGVLWWSRDSDDSF